MKSGILVTIFVLIVGIIGGVILYNAQTIQDIKNDTVSIKEAKVRGGSEDIVDDEESPKVLIAYFSHTGNTREMARQIQEATGGDIFEVTPVEPCPEDYDACKAIATTQKEENARPGITATVKNINEYDVVFVGYPLWLSTMPMHMFTFLDAHDLSGKVVIPFCTSGSGKIGESEADIAKSLPDADMRKGLVIKSELIEQSNEEVLTWLDGLDIEF